MTQHDFSYTPTCTAAGCAAPARYKIAAPWSDGTSRELKTYGLACESHRESLLARASLHGVNLRLAEGETLGKAGVYRLVPGARDGDLTRLPDHDTA